VKGNEKRPGLRRGENVEGERIVITSDRTLMSGHRDSFYFGFATVLPTRLVPGFLQHRIFCPPPPSNPDGTARFAGLPLRCVESAFIENGVPEGDIGVVHPNNLHRVIGKRTDLVCVSAMDPLGMGPVTTTWASLMGGVPFNRLEFERLLKKEIPRLRERYDFKLVVGGPGSWQLSSDGLLDRFRIDHLVVGEVETIIPEILNSPSRRVITGGPCEPYDIPPIRNPTAGGLVEITRGCGKGCKYCTPNLSGRLRSLPLGKIVSDVGINAQTEGSGRIILHSDDALNYGSTEVLPDEDAVMELYEAVFRVDGVKRVHMTHTCLAPFANLPEFIERLTRLLRKHGHRYYVCQPGVETGSPRLMKALMPGKCLPYSTDEWPDVVREAFRVMNENRWIAAGTIMVGLPGEEREDTLQTIELVRSLAKYNTVILVPIFFDPINTTAVGDREACLAGRMTEESWRLMVVCWKHNLRVIRQVYDVTASKQHDLFTGATMRVGMQVMKSVFPLLEARFHKRHGH
jgi:radical SAM superfamily enzyme YgiQ (UPF0313 family)